MNPPLFYAQVLLIKLLTWAHSWAHNVGMRKRIRVNTPIAPDNEKKAKKLVKKRIWGKLVNEWLREMEF